MPPVASAVGSPWRYPTSCTHWWSYRRARAC